MMDYCGTTDIRSLLLGGVFLILSPVIALGLLSYFVYCKLTGKAFLEAEARELEEARKRPPIDLRRI